MKTFQVQVADYLAGFTMNADAGKSITLDHVVALAISAELSARKNRENIGTRAKRGRPEAQHDALATSPTRHRCSAVRNRHPALAPMILQ